METRNTVTILDTDEGFGVRRGEEAETFFYPTLTRALKRAKRIIEAGPEEKGTK